MNSRLVSQTILGLAITPLLFCGGADSVLASEPGLKIPAYSPREKLVVDEFDHRLSSLENPKKWAELLEMNPKAFPSVEKNSGVTVQVDREELKLNKETFAAGLGYRQAFIAAPPERVQKILTTPALFQAMFELDASSTVLPKDLGEAARAPAEANRFLARIVKKVPVIDDQDYTLDYSNHKEGDLWFQRARLARDEKNFALRDNLMVVAPAPGGTLFREVSYVYVLHWYVRALGAQMRSVMKTELTVITKTLKCLAENPREEVTADDAKACAKTARAES